MEIEPHLHTPERRKFKKRKTRKQDIANLSLNITQVVSLAGFIWTAAQEYSKYKANQQAVLQMVGDTKSDIGRLAERVERIETK